ncbi:MAG: PQQ-binding-like beta-propeller repeat protein [Euryarchaeota archaeon]|nr:PQQ-binding-like beta-propeller repeat protein [Euryarchaeota archaeon]
MGRGRNMHHKNLGSEKRKKNFILTSITLLSILALLVSVTIAPAIASDWPQFQTDKTNTGIVNEKILGRSLAWSAYTHTDPWNMAGIDVVPIVAVDNVYVLDVLGYIWSFNAKTGAVNGNKYYNAPASPPYYQLSTPAYGSGKIFFGMSSGANKGHVFAVNANDVTVKVWEKTINEDEQINTPITYDDNKIYFGTWNGTAGMTYSGTYYCLSAADGSELWNHTATGNNGYYWAGACIIDDYIIFGSDLGIVTCLDESTGALVDEQNLADVVSNAGQIRSSVTCNADGIRVFFSEAYTDGDSIGGRVWAYDFNSATGNLSYAWNCSLNTASKSTPVVYNGRIYVVDGSFQANGRLYCIYESNGTIEWYYTVSDNKGNGSPGITASPVISVADNELYIYFTTNCENGRLYCINKTGELCWYYEPMESIGSGEYILQGVSVYSDGGDMRVFFGNDAGNLYALDNGMCGDMDANGDIRASDAQKIWNRAENPEFYLDSPWAADVDCNGEISTSDAKMVWMRAVDTSYDLNCCCDGPDG